VWRILKRVKGMAAITRVRTAEYRVRTQDERISTPMMCCIAQAAGALIRLVLGVVLTGQPRRSLVRARFPSAGPHTMATIGATSMLKITSAPYRAPPLARGGGDPARHAQSVEEKPSSAHETPKPPRTRSAALAASGHAGMNAKSAGAIGTCA